MHTQCTPHIHSNNTHAYLIFYPQAYIDVGKLDGGLTSSIAISLLYNGLIDLKVLPERAFGTV